MASNCDGRRLSELLQEQQEPFLLLHGEALLCCSVAEACGRRLRGLCDRGSVRQRQGGSHGGATSTLGKAVRRKLPLRWHLAGCFSCGVRQRFRRLPRDVFTEFDDDGGREEDQDGGRQLSPVSVLQLHSDEESPTLSNWEEDEKPSTSGSSPPSDHDSPCFTFHSNRGKICAAEVEEKEQRIVSAWERIAADISRIPRLVELDLAGSVREWRRHAGEEEARRVGESVEAMIFEEVRWEAMRDMLCFA
ncbi:uncharacterized protein LOC133906082 [Phragmites australis]|uniref:uncharacterized protein LOC133906082 n=1 Tax=Phragmites australis TaxID=29695 RepID=UPI002D78499D|nr:uncharacterized protein LOC133906082 [Phragmites australis]